MIRVGPFELREPLGRGGIAEVWSAVHAAQSVPVAIKVVTAHYARSEAFLETFRTEIQAVARLDHPGIVMILDHGIIDARAESESGGALVAGSPFLAMELASEGSLDRLKGPLAWSDLYRVLMGLLDALAHAHARGVIHRDIKPANVLVAAFRDHRPGLKLTDFGIAHAVGLDPDLSEASKRATLGTPTYMAPEQFFGNWRDFGPWTDLYALGCLGFTLASGRPPFRGTSAKELARLHVREAPPPLSSPHRLPPAFEGWLGRLLAKDPHERFARAADASYALYQIDLAEQRATGAVPSIDKTGEHVTRLIAQARAPENTELTPPPYPVVEVRARTDGDELRHAMIARGDELVTQLEDTRHSLSAIEPLEVKKPLLDVPAALVPPMPQSWRSRAIAMPPPALVGAGLRLYGLRAIRLVDREAERDALWMELSAVSHDRRARGVIVRGAAGNGKTRLVEAIAERADEVGAAIVLRATHSPIPSAADGLPRMMARYLRAIGLELGKVERRAKALLERRGATDPYEWQALTELMVPSADEGGGERRVRFSNADERHFALRRAIERIATERPVIVWIDDAQWGGDALAFARALLEAQDESPSRVLFVVTVRDEAIAERSLEGQQLAELARRAEVRTIEVGRLSKADQRRLVEELLSLEPKLAARVAARTDGNPLFAVQLVGDWVERGVLVLGERGFALQAGEKGRIPDDIHAVWTARIARVLERYGPEASRALEAASVLGNEIDAAEWRTLVERVGARVPPTLLLDLIAHRLAEPTQQGWIFAHGMVRESIERELIDRGRSAELHLAAARMLEARHARGVRGVAERVGRHLVAAGEDRLALAPLFVAATERWEVSELGEAQALLELRERAVERARLPDSDPSASEGELLLAQIEIVRGRLDAAARLASAVADRAVARADARWSALHVKAIVTLAHATYEKGDQSTAVALYTRARERAEATKDAPSIVRAIQGLADAAYRLGDLSGAGGLYGEALARAKEAKLDTAMAEAHWGLGYVALWRGEYTVARAHFEEQRRILVEQKSQLGMARAHNALGEVARLEGDLDSAEREYRRALALHHAIGSSGTLVTRLNVALVLLMRKDPASAERVLVPLLKELAKAGERGHLLAGYCQILPCHAANRDFAAWDRDLALIDELLAETKLKDGDVALSLEIAGVAALAAQDRGRAAQALERALVMWKSLGRAQDVSRVERVIGRALGEGEETG